MIKLTRLPNPSEALFLHTYKVSGTVTYYELAAFEKGIQNCFGFDSSEAESFRNIEITDADGNELTNDDTRALQAERDDLKRKYENVTMYAQGADDQIYKLQSQLSEMTGCRNSAVNLKNELQRRCDILETGANATQKELDRVTGALHLEQKAHDETKQQLGRTATKLGDLMRAVREYADKRAKYGTACHEGHTIAEALFEIIRETVLDNE